MNKEQRAFFDELYSVWFPKLCWYTLSAVKNHYVAEELVQDTFLVAMQKVDQLMAAEAPERWLKQTVKYKMLHYFRAQKQEQKWLVSLAEEGTAEPRAPDLLEQAEESEEETLARTKDLIRRSLKDEEWRLLQKVALEGKSYQQAAEELEISLWACQKRMQRIREKIRKILPKEER